MTWQMIVAIERGEPQPSVGPAMQVRLHQQVSSTAGVTNIMAKVADAIPGIARAQATFLRPRF